MRRVVAGVAIALLALTPSCGGREEPTRLRLETDRLDADGRLHLVSFELRCDPAEGTLPDPEKACATVAAHPEMLRPPPGTGTCAGSTGVPPNVSVRGTADGDQIDFSVRGCDRPDERGRAADLWRRVMGLSPETAYDP